MLLWTMMPITLALIVVQEMSARMGVVTGKGLSDLIREEFGLRMTFVIMILLVIVNYGNVVAEFSGIAGIDAAVPREQVYQRAGLRGDGVAAGGEGRLQECREGISGGERFVPRLHHGWGGERAGLAYGA